MRKVWLFAFASIALAQEGRPAFTGVLCSRFDNGAPIGITAEFFTDSRGLGFRFEAKDAPAAGVRLTPGLAHGDGTPIGRGQTVVADGKATAWINAFDIAGQAWAQNGGEFRWRLFLDDEPKPVLELPFKVTAGKRWALLVGINDYPGNDSDLTGCDVDVENMRFLLQEVFQFPQEQITIVRDLDATRARIEKELTDLADKAGPTDAVVFSYSGHGTQVPDLDGDEADGWDEGICPAEPKPKTIATEEQLATFLTDDRLAELLGRFKTRNLTVIFDCCHSGTGLRTGDAVPTLPVPLERPRWQEVSFSRALQEKAAEARARSRGGAAEPAGSDMGLDASERWVFIAGCQSWEMSSGDNVNGGAMTHPLASVLLRSSGQSWDAILSEVRVAATRRNAGQSPTAEGATRRYPFSLAEAPADAPYVRPTFAVAGAVPPGRTQPIVRQPTGSAGKEEALVAGLSSLGAEQIGVACDVYPPLRLPGEAPKGRVELTGKMLATVEKDAAGRPGREVASSVAKILEGEVAAGDRLVPRTARVPLARPRIGFEGADAMRDTVVALYQRLRSVPSVEAVAEWKLGEVDYILSPVAAEGQMMVRVFNRSGGYLTHFAGAESDVVRKTCDFVVSRHGNFTRLIRMHNTSAPFLLKVSSDGEGVRRPGQRITMSVVTSEPAYLYVWDAFGENSVLPLLSTKEPIPAGDPMRIEIDIPAEFTGRLFLKVFATTKPLDVDFAAMEATDKPAAMLAQLQAAFPGGAADLVSTDGWADEMLSFDVQKE
ncbi:MAG: caspase domain-containing protein [Planctomycetota bacterium]